MKKDENRNMIKSIAEYLMAGLLLVYMILCTPLISHAECVTVNNVYNRITDGELCYEILDKKALTVQVGYGKDTEPSASATGLYNKEITDLVIPDTVQYQGDTYQVVKISCYAFYRCTGLHSITIGENIEDISVGAFKGCSNVSSVVWNARSVNDFAASNELGNGNVFTNMGSDADGISLKFGEEVERIPARAFFTNASSHQYCDKIVSVAFGDNIREIGEYAFSNSVMLESVQLPAKLGSISSFCFADCTGLKEIIIPDGVGKIEKKAFFGCTAIESLTVGSGIKSIANDVFSGCRNMSKINWNVINMTDLPSSNGIFYNAGQDAADGIQVVFGPDVEYIPSNLFFPKAAATKQEYVNITSIIFQNSESDSVRIGENAFRGCAGLMALELAENVVSVGKNAFYGCTGLTELYWNAKQIQDFVSGNGVFESLGTDSTGVTLYVGEQVQSIPAYAFASNEGTYAKNCNIRAIQCARSLPGIEIGDSAFRGCASLTECDWNGAVTAIGDYAFYGCAGLNQLVLNSQEKIIGKYAFSTCSNVTLVVLGDNVQSIGKGAFNNIGTTSRCAADCYNRSSAVMEKGATYSGNYFTVYCPLRVLSEHGTYSLQGASIVTYLDEDYYAAGDKFKVEILPDSMSGEAWKIDYVSCNGNVLQQESDGWFAFVMPGCAVELAIYYLKFTAMIDSQGFDSLQAAIDAAVDGDTIQLLEDVVIQNTVRINKTIVLDGKGHCVRRENNIKMLQVTAGEVHIADMTWDGNNKSGAIVDVTGGVLYLEEACVIQNNTMSEENAGLGCGSVYVQGGSVYLVGGRIMKNQAPNGAGVYLAAGEFIMDDGTICGNQALSSGGGVYVKDGADFTLNGGSISDNSCSQDGYGAGIYLGNAVMYLSGNPEVNDNKKGSAQHNLYMPSKDTRLVLSAALTGADIGVTLAVNPSVDTSGADPVYTNMQLTQNAGSNYVEGSIHADHKNYDIVMLEDAEIYMIRPVYQIIFDANGGSMCIDGAKVDRFIMNIKKGEALGIALEALNQKKPVLSGQDGRKCVGWYDEDKHALAEIEPAVGNAVYFAKWAFGICNEPVIDIAEGLYKEPITVTIAAEEGDTIYYTLDGTVPSENALKYEKPLVLTEDTVLKAVCMREDYGDSRVVARSYLIRSVECVKVNAPKKVFKGETVSLSATVLTGNRSTSKEVKWSLPDDGYQEGTRINAEGVLSVAVDERKEAVTICATSVEDGEKQDMVTIPMAARYRIYYHLGYDAEEEVKAGELHEAGDEITLMTVERAGYTFGGWSTAGEVGSELVYEAGDSFVMGNADIHLYAKWIPNIISSISIVKAEAPDVEISTLHMQNGDSIALDVKLEGTGTFSDSVIWSMEKGVSSSDTKIEDGLLTIGADETAEYLIVKATSGFDDSKVAVLYVTIDVPEYMVSFSANAGSVENGAELISGNMPSLTVLKNGVVNVPACGYICNGYIFTGWNTAADGSGTAFAVKDTFSPTGDVTLYAQWEKVIIVPEITGIMVAKSGAPDMPIMEDAVNKGESVSYTADVSGVGEYDQTVIWSLDGKHEEGTAISDTGVLTVTMEETASTITVVATAKGDATKKAMVVVTIIQRKPEKPDLETCIISFSNNVDSIDKAAVITGNMESVQVQKDTEYTVPDSSYICEGYIFTGWNTEKDGNGMAYEVKDIFTVTENVTLYAQWKLISAVVPDTPELPDMPELPVSPVLPTPSNPVTGPNPPAGSVKKTEGIGTTMTDTITKSVVKVTNSGTVVNGKVEGAEVIYVKPSHSDSVIKIPDAVTLRGVTYKVTAIASNALKNNKKVTTVVIGENVKTMGVSAFMGCTRLKKVTMGSSVTNISKQAFKGCKKLTNITIGKNVTKIGDKAFEKCTALKKITIPSKVKEIGKLVFNGDKNLKTIKIKSSVLKKVGSRTFKGINKKAVIKIPKKMRKKYGRLLKNKGQKSSVKIKY